MKNAARENSRPSGNISGGWAGVAFLLVWLALISAGLFVVLRMERSRELLPGIRVAPLGKESAEIQLPNFSEAPDSSAPVSR